MKVFLSWLVANFEVFVTVLLCIVFGILFAVGIDSSVFTTQEKWGLIAVAVFFMALPASITVKNFEMSMIMFLLMLAGYIYVIVSPDVVSNATLPWMPTALIASGAVSLVVALAIGIYTAINMDDVVSRRMLYVNSDVGMFDMTLKYSLNRFMAAFVYISWAGLWTVGYIFVKSLSV